MSDFAVNVVAIDAIEPIDGADKIELAVIGEYRSIVQRGTYQPGDLAVYLPEGAVLPDWLIIKLNLVGKLSGGKRNRIKAIKLRGCLSQGIMYGLRKMHDNPGEFGQFQVSGEGSNMIVERPDQDYAEFLGIKKYDPTEAMDPSARKLFLGTCAYIPGFTKPYDLENWKKYSHIFQEGEEVFITEKLHGTLCAMAYWPGMNHPEFPNDTFVYSKGLGKGGQVFKWTEENANNLYLRAFHGLTETTTSNSLDFSDPTTASVSEIPHTVFDRWDYTYWCQDEEYSIGPVFIFGEVFGANVQDLGYGLDKPTFRAFDVWLGTPTKGRFLSPVEKYRVFALLGIEHVPVLYKGPYSRDTVLQLTDGKTTFGNAHIREGIVITPAVEQNVHRFGRKVLKNVSGDYLTRKGNTTEFN